MSVEHGCGGYERRCSFSAPFREGDVVSKKLESDHVRPVGSELRTGLRHRVGGTALTYLYATGTCIPQSRSKHSTPRGLNDKGRSERRLFFNPSQQPRQEIPEISLARQDVPVQLPTVWTVVGPVDLYQCHKATSDCSQNTGHENNHLHRRHPGDGTKHGTGSGTHRVPDISVG